MEEQLLRALGQIGHPASLAEISSLEKLRCVSVEEVLKKCIAEGKIHTFPVSDFGVTVELYYPAMSDETNPGDAETLRQIADVEQQLQAIQSEIDALNGERKRIQEELIDPHLKRLHEYNDIKDAAVEFMGRLANLEAVTTKSLYERYGLDVTD